MYNFDTWEQYKSFTLMYFNSVNGCINKICYSANLEIVGDCYIHDNYGELSFPSTVKIYLKTILDMYDDYDTICSIIVFVITHELFHIDYHMSALCYSNDSQYRSVIEDVTDSAAYNFIMNNLLFIEKIFHFKFNLPKVYIPKISYLYPRAGIEDFYIQTIVNIIARDIEVYPSINNIFHDYPTVFISINQSNKIALKFEGIYPIYNMEQFINLINQYAADSFYDMKMSIGFGKDYAHIIIEIMNRIIDPIVY